MTLSVDVRRSFGRFKLDAVFESGGRLTALFGPSGSGKTSLVNLIAGLARPDEGRIAVDGRVLVDTQKHIHLAKHRRRIGYVFQDARLFPHMSVRQNLAYGRFFAPKGERQAEFGHVVELLGIGHLLERKPRLLSGGERQRVAVGRALLSNPLLLLMDEPLAALDDARKAEIMPYLERLRDETRIPIVYVSHSIVEVARLASDIVILSEGRVAAHGPTAEIMRRLDLLPPEERGEGGAVLDMVVRERDVAFGMVVLRSAAGTIHVPQFDAPLGSIHRVRIRARDVILSVERPAGLSAMNILSGRIAEIGRAEGPLVDIRLDCNGEAVLSRITLQSLTRLGLAVGMEVHAIVKAVAIDSGTTPQMREIHA